MKLSFVRAALPATAASLLGSLSFGQAVQVDERLADYEPVQGISGEIKSVGSDTMNNLMAFWGEGFKKHYPNVTTEVEGKGSSTAPPALIAGTSNFGPMSREMKSTEIDEFEAKFGYKPTALPTSIDMLAVYVHKDNPLQGLTLAQVDAIFSQTRKGGLADDITTWGQLGLAGDWAQKPISLYGRNSASGTYGYFKKKALFGGDYKNSVKEQPGSSSVVGGIAQDSFGMGYSGIGYKTADVRALALGKDEGALVEASAANAYTGKYPLARFLYVYINHKPNGELDPLRREFVRYIFSKQGQEDVLKAGYYPVTAEIAAKALGELGLESKPLEAGAEKP